MRLSAIFLCAPIALSALVLGCTATDEDLTHEQEFFWLVTNILAGSNENLTQEEAADWLFHEMRAIGPTSRAKGAVADLAESPSIEVDSSRTYDDGAPIFEVTIRSNKGKTTRWAVSGYQWTYLNHEARKWLKENDYLDVCDSVRDFGKEREDDLVEVIGEGCRVALEGGSVD